MMTRTLAAAIAAVLISPAALAQSVADRDTYMIEFDQDGLVAFHQAHNARSVAFDARRPEIDAYRGELVASHQAFRQVFNSVLARPVEVTHYYLATHSGMAAKLTADEAERVRTLPGVRAIERARDEELHTYRGPTFIGADTIWNGTNVPQPPVGTRGEGMVIGVLDTGLVFPHPSFNDDASCGHGGANPSKVLSMLDCSSTDVTGLCNGASPVDTNGHGSHTAGISGGNRVTTSASPPPPVPAGFTEISGVAPCANLRIYKVCPTNSCPGADITAGLNSVLLHGDVDVTNFSISGGTSPWTPGDSDRRKLDMVAAGIITVASAGNTSATITNPVGQVNHRGPWVLSVANSTHDGTAFATVSASGPGTPPANLQNIAASKGSASPNGTSHTDLPIRHFTGQPATAEGCTPGADGAPADLTPFPAGFFNGAAALIHRGTCPFTVKVTNAFNAGASFVLIRNNQATALNMNTTGQPAGVAAYSIEQAPGNALVSFVDANPGTATINVSLFLGDVLNASSLRGPTPAPLADVQKPNITGPGTNILAAGTGAAGYITLSGTSMSGPHLAGAAALIKDLHPAWTPMEVLSSIQTTADRTGTKDNLQAPWDADDVGSGAVDLRKAARVGLVMDETVVNFLAANPGTGGDVKTLNLPALRNVACSPTCTFTRTFRNPHGTATTWNITAENPTGFEMQAAPASFLIPAGGTQAVTFTITPTLGEPGTAIRFGTLLLTQAIPGRGSVTYPEQHLTVAVRGAGPSINLFSNGFE